jgi:hypothetical protein
LGIIKGLVINTIFPERWQERLIQIKIVHMPMEVNDNDSRLRLLVLAKLDEVWCGVL